MERVTHCEHCGAKLGTLGCPMKYCRGNDERVSGDRAVARLPGSGELHATKDKAPEST